MIDIVKVIENRISQKLEVYPQHVNRASSAGHPCERFLVYARLNWQEKLRPDLGMQIIFNDGNMHEADVLKTLREAGFDVQESQRSFAWDKFQVTGKIDGMIVIDGNKYPLEVKSMSQFQWDKIKNAEDIKGSFTYYIKGYYDQMQLYLLMAGHEEGMILLKNKANGRLKQINISIDYEYAESLVQKLERVNKAVSERYYPERVAERSPCKYCSFRHICLPDEVSDSIQIIDNAELLELLEQREALRESAKSYEDIDKKLKGYWESVPEGVHLVGGKFQVKISSYERKFVNIPEDLKKQYEETKPVTRTVITCLK